MENKPRPCQSDQLMILTKRLFSACTPSHLHLLYLEAQKQIFDHSVNSFCWGRCLCKRQIWQSKTKWPRIAWLEFVTHRWSMIKKSGVSPSSRLMGGGLQPGAPSFRDSRWAGELYFEKLAQSNCFQALSRWRLWRWFKLQPKHQQMRRHLYHSLLVY